MVLDLAIALSVAALFVVGLYQAHKQGASPAAQLGLGLLGGLIGVLVIALEVFLAH